MNCSSVTTININNGVFRFCGLQPVKSLNSKRSLNCKYFPKISQRFSTYNNVIGLWSNALHVVYKRMHNYYVKYYSANAPCVSYFTHNFQR